MMVHAKACVRLYIYQESRVLVENRSDLQAFAYRLIEEVIVLKLTYQHEYPYHEIQNSNRFNSVRSTQPPHKVQFFQELPTKCAWRAHHPRNPAGNPAVSQTDSSPSDHQFGKISAYCRIIYDSGVECANPDNMHCLRNMEYSSYYGLVTTTLLTMYDAWRGNPNDPTLTIFVPSGMWPRSNNPRPEMR
jgi:hypothetical protein